MFKAQQKLWEKIAQYRDLYSKINAFQVETMHPLYSSHSSLMMMLHVKIIFILHVRTAISHVLLFTYS